MFDHQGALFAVRCVLSLPKKTGLNLDTLGLSFYAIRFVLLIAH